MDLYQQNIMERYKRPRCQGKLESVTHRAETANPLCGDRLELYLKVSGDTVQEAKWQGEGCVLSLASVDMLVEELKGKTLKHVQAITNDWLLKALGVNPSPSRLKCALLPLEALVQALQVKGK